MNKKKLNTKKRILKYNDNYVGMNKKNLKYYKKSDNSLLLDRKEFTDYFNKYNDLKTLIIDEELIKKEVIEIYGCKAENIYIENHQNLGGITIPYDFFINNRVTIKFYWDKKEKTNINKINIVIKDNVIPIERKLIEEMIITYEKNNLLIKIENYNSKIMYNINSSSEIEKEYIAREITKDDIKNNTLDIREFNKYEKIYFDILKIDKLIINKDILKRMWDYENIFNNLKFNKIDIIDDNEMKLFPTTKEIEINDKDRLTKHVSDYHGDFIEIENDSNIKIIYIDKEDNIIYLNKEYLEKKYNIKNSNIIYERKICSSNFMILIEDNDNNYKVILDDKEYILDETFKTFLLLNSDIYIPDNLVDHIKTKNWFKVIGENNFTCSNFSKIYIDYLEYKERLNKLKKLGFSYNALMYLHDRKINSIINPETEEGLIDLNDLKDYEINSYNLIGEEYIKTKKLKK